MPEISSIRPWYLRAPFVVFTLIAAGVIFVVATGGEIRAARSALTALTVGHAEQVRQVVSESQSHALSTFEAWEAQAGLRLLALAALVDHLARHDMHANTQALLDSIATANGLACLTVRQPDRHVLAASTHAPGTRGEIACWRDLEQAGVFDLKPGESRVLRAPTEDGSGYRLIGAIRRVDGGIVCAGLDAEALAAERRRIGPGRLLRALGERAGSVYLALQDANGILSATANVESLSSVAGDPLLQRVLATGEPASREIKFGGRRVLEQVTRLDVAGRPVSLLRTAVDLSEVRRRQRAIARSIGLHSLLLLVTLAAGAALLIASRRLVVAQTAWAQARREVAALEAERSRRERSVALGELASGVAHEIRNPLNAIHMVAQRLGREFTPTAGGEEYRRLTDTVRDEVGRLNRIVQQFLAFARPAAPQLREVDLAAVVREVVTLVRGRFEAHGVALTDDLPERLVVPADADLMRQALHNLLDNALDACAAGASVAVVLQAGEAVVRLIVTDTGTGIPPAELPRIFNLYHTTKPAGTGVGLAIVDQVAAQHGGRVRVESELGRGTSFIFEFPPGNRGKGAA
ncbi:MAG: sensor histidine kinase [Candidatus Krumholzibacteriia bacterium]